MHMNYKNQIKFKQNKIKNIVSKYLNSNIKINDIVYDNDKNYRNKVTFQVKEKLGFYNDNSYELINIDNCLISDKLINKIIPYLNKLNLKYINKIICRTGSNELMIIIESNKNINIDVLKGIASSIYLKTNNNYKHIYGNKNIYEKIGDYKYIISPYSFFQTNTKIAEKLYKKIKEYVNENNNILDLYCGTGSIGIYVNKNNNVIGIEKNESAIKDALENIKINN
mgnify:CR=1 FL=1